MSKSNKRRKKICVKRLEDVEVQYLSLVERGANRIPFRIFKEDENMSIDLGKLFLRKKETPPQLVGFAVAKGDTTEGLTQAIQSVDGIEILEIDDTDEHAVVLKMEGFGSEEMTTIRINEDVAAFYVGVEKGISTIPDENSFKANMNKAGFLPSVRLASDLMVETIMSAVYSEGDQEQTVSKIEKVLSDFSEYVKGLLNAIPSQAFKQEDQLVKGMLITPTNPPKEEAEVGSEQDAGQSGTGDDATGNEPASQSATGPEAAAASGESSEELAPSTEGEGDSNSEETTDAQEADLAKAVSEAVAAQVKELQEAMKSVVSPLASSIEEIKGAVDAVKEEQQKQGERLEAVEEKATKAELATKGTVLSGAHNTEGDRGPATKSQDPESGLWDSVLNFMDFEPRG